MMKSPTLSMVGVAAAVLLLSGCSSTPDITGSWSASDGSPTKIINPDGTCSGMYYNAGKPLDIGGTATCSISSTADRGEYQLTVRQPPNQTTYDVAISDETMTLSQNSTDIVTLNKQ